ncbi:MAG: VOC family protein [Gemmatimonadetes bacterium]|nr:VOC family protein [Gemmatimonadota bacterium]
MNLPVADVGAAVPFYEAVLGFRVAHQEDTPLRAATLARDDVQMRVVENGGDPTQDGCAFHVTGLDALQAAFRAAGLSSLSGVDVEQRADGPWNVFYVVAPDGLCYWFGERQG